MQLFRSTFGTDFPGLCECISISQVTKRREGLVPLQGRSEESGGVREEELGDMSLRAAKCASRLTLNLSTKGAMGWVDLKMVVGIKRE